ncbi:hypothetical protein, partial [uncultured Duncaniella sp.]|uniref:hypothetical protein n=1 Tax=uncultured Duncaniella sp. TaxID=2768039 RepID=UPI0025E57129
SNYFLFLFLPKTFRTILVLMTQMLNSGLSDDKILDFFAKNHDLAEKTLKKVCQVDKLSYLCAVFEA